MRTEITAARANLDAAEKIAAALPQREWYLRVVHGLGCALLDVHEQWLDDAERELRRDAPGA